MPLDPFFADRLRTHRAYLVRSTLQGFAKRRGWPWLSRLALRIAPPPAASSAGTVAPSGAAAEKGGVGAAVTQGSTPAAAKPAAAKKSAPKKTTRKKPKKKPTRASHRKAAIAWDATELDAVGQAGPDVRIEEHTVSVPGRPDVRVRIYYPDLGSAPNDDDRAAVPATLAFYGGGFRIGGIDYPTTDAGFRLRAFDAGVAVVAVDYALAPEHKFPAAVEQGGAALGWLADNASRLGIDGKRLAISGISAGGNIAASVALANRDGRNVPLRLQLLEVPVVDLTGRHIDFAPVRAMGVPTIFAIREMRSVARTYLPNPSDARNPLASPLLAPSHAGLPPAHILTAEFDALRGEGAAYGAKIRADGGDATVVRYLGMTHDTPIFLGAVPAARRWHRDVVTALRTLHDD
ncbi:acetyl esterase/lipase [Labedella gwakjiensis]|uniref:Acetyl esterase/lipase n=1 Tax=Labedella gwakjiensis TaxID=390269 RepID=A0A2P8GZC6_9MICO|nr:alpha/beta hydrolase [Labedella gwakjiensis]PSL39300.1 acetyl esterase/lipase [Labedella gwakjiensis]RUQ86279.1 alpha/beta hydrolase [Labedella gwakjiensis]